MGTDKRETLEHKNCKHGHGPTSFWMQDPNIIFFELKLKRGDVFLDVGCGSGDYSFEAAKLVGEKGKVYTLDINPETISKLKERIFVSGLKNIEANLADITKRLPLEDNCIDFCFVATVLHSINLEEYGRSIYQEIRRVLKQDGCLAILECKKEDMAFGPPMKMRLSPKELERSITQYGFEKIGLVDLGHNYMIQFKVKNAPLV